MPDPVRWDVRRFASLGSTSDYLMAEARSGTPAGTVAMADHQTAGRGRRGRTWEAPPGASLLVSVLLRPTLDAERLHLCAAVVALAAADACAEVAGVTVGLKWPNDLVVADGKLAGVLAESDPGAAGGPPGSTAVVVGIGLNICWPGPPGAGGVALAELAGRDVDRFDLLQSLLGGVATRLTVLDGGDPDATLAELRARCVTIGRSVRVELADRMLEGTAVGLDDRGHLVVRAEGVDHAIAAGDVVHLRPAVGKEPTGPAEPEKGLK